MALTAFQRSFMEHEPQGTPEREEEFLAAGMSSPRSAGGGNRPSVKDWRLYESLGITEVQEQAMPLGGFAPGALLPKVLAVGAGIYAGAQALGMGEGEGLFGIDLIGGGATPPPPGAGGGVPFEGPGLREPSAQYVVKEWKRRIDSRDGDYNLQFYLTQMPGRAYRIYMYSQKTKGWKSWGLPRPAVIGKNMPSHKMLTRLRRNLKKHADDAKTILMIASPTAYARNLGYKKPPHRHR